MLSMFNINIDVVRVWIVFLFLCEKDCKYYHVGQAQKTKYDVYMCEMPRLKKV